MTVRLVELGRTGRGASAIGLACNRLGATLGGCAGAQAERLVRHALDAGITLFDTADIYGQGDSERLLGAGLRGQRDRVVLVSKAGQRFSFAQRAAALAKRPVRHAARALPQLRAAIAERRAGPLPRDFRPQHLRHAIEGSLRRLGTDRLDIFLLHSPSPLDLEANAGFELLDRLVQAGTIGTWGVDCDDIETTAAALHAPSVCVVQVPLAVALSPSGARALAEASRREIAVLVRDLPDAAPDWDATDFDARRFARGHAIRAAWSVPGAAALVHATQPAQLDEILLLARDRTLACGQVEVPA